MLTVGGVGCDGLCEISAVFLELCFEYFLECSEIDIVVAVVFFGALGGGIESNMTEMRLKSSSDEELELDSFLFFLGASIVPIVVLSVLFVLVVVSAL